MNGEPLPARARLPGPAGHARALRLRRRHQVAGEAHPDDVRRPRGLLDQARSGPPTRRSSSPAGSTRPAPVHHRRRPARHRRCRLGAARGVAKVEVRLDEGEWQEAKLGPSGGVEYWRQWYLPWKATSGQPPDRRARHRPERQDPDHRPGRPRSPTVQRHPGGRRHRRLKAVPSSRIRPGPIRSGSSPEPLSQTDTRFQPTKGTP